MWVLVGQGLGVELVPAMSYTGLTLTQSTDFGRNCEDKVHPVFASCHKMAKFS